jgi:tRNA pseudouridine13 synthase
LVGYRMTMPEGEPLEIEKAAMTEVSLAAKDFRQSGKMRVKGARRPLRIKPQNIEIAGGVDAFGGHITVAFTLPAGAFATVLLRELMKSDDESDDADSETAEAAGNEMASEAEEVS